MYWTSDTTALVEENFRGWNKETLAPWIFSTIADMDEYWPLTVRQVFYQLVAGLLIENSQNSYKKVSVALTKLRRLGIVPWGIIEDRTRRLTEKKGDADLETYIRRYTSGFFNGYDRCLVQNQENYVEIFTEKDALTRLIEDVAWVYCVRIVVIRGQISATFLQDYADRAKKAISNGRHPVILYFGDLDPSGCRIPISIVSKLATQHDLKAGGVTLDRIALNRAQVDEYKLPHSFDSIKIKDPNYEWYVKKYGRLAVELDALHPEKLQTLVKYGLGRHLDIEDMKMQQGVEAKERDKLERLHERFREIARDEGIDI